MKVSKNKKTAGRLCLILISATLTLQVLPVCPSYAYTQDQIADAIFLVEGGLKTKHPYGILSVHCEGQVECRRVCLNTIKNNLKRWEKSDKTLTYLEFLAKRYAPVGSDTDNGTNKFWLSNLRYFLDKANK